MDQRRLVGGVAGLLMLVGVLALPFFNYIGNSMESIAYDLAADPTTGFADILATEIVFIVAFALILIAGLVGLWPRASGILGLVGSLIFIADGYTDANSTVHYGLGDLGAGAYLVLLGTVIALFVGFFWRKKGATASQPMASASGVPPTPMSQPPPPPPQAEPNQQAMGGSVFCPNCGRPAASGQKFCKNCGASLG